MKKSLMTYLKLNKTQYTKSKQTPQISKTQTGSYLFDFCVLCFVQFVWVFGHCALGSV